MASPSYVRTVPPDRLLFTPDEAAGCVRSVILISNTSEESVSFKVKTTAPKLFTVHPAHGTLHPHDSLSISVSAPTSGSITGKDRIQISSLPSSIPSNSLLWSSDPRLQNSVLETRLLPSAELIIMRSFVNTSFEPGSRQSMEEKRIMQELRSDCDDLQHEVEDLRRKVRSLEAGIVGHRPPPPKDTPLMGFGNLHLLVCLLLGLLLSLLLY